MSKSDSNYDNHMNMILNTAEKLEKDNYIELSNELINNFTWHNTDDVDITNVMDKFKITGPELFRIMYLSGFPCNYGILSFDIDKHNDFTLEEAENYLKKCNYVDWYNGHGIKNRFRMSDTEKQSINVRRFDDRNYQGCFYNCILTLIKVKKDQIQRYV